MGTKQIEHNVLEIIHRLTGVVDDLVFELGATHAISETLHTEASRALKDISSAIEMLDKS